MTYEVERDRERYPMYTTSKYENYGSINIGRQYAQLMT